MGTSELEHINEAFATNWISTVGPQINAFEEKLEEYCGVDHAAVLASGTAAIHLALRMLNIGPGDYVIGQTFTFAGTVNPILYQGAMPIFIDSEPQTWNLDPALVEESINQIHISTNKLPKAIIPVHLYGMPYNISAIHEVAAKYNIPVIEDAAEALGSTFDGKPCGSFGDMAVLSFNGNKIITTSGGGALLSDNKDYIDKAKFLATQARDDAPHYEHTTYGYNYRMGNINAAIGLGQMEVLDERVNRRRQIWQTYYDEFKEIFEFQLPDESLSSEALAKEETPTNQQTSKLKSNRWLTAILTDSFETRENIRLGLENQNIESRPLWKPMHMQPVFKDLPYFGGNVAEDMFNRGLCLPSGSGMSHQDLERVIMEIKKIL
jgi:dTDP-4-amino-4,6-dideoxygalactose transaminase